MRNDDIFRDAALLAARGLVGAGIAAHGAQKLFGWFGGPGPDGASKMMQSLGFDPPQRFATAASATEIAAGVLIATGAGGPLGPALLASVMTTAALTVHVKNGFFAQNQGFELNALYATAGLLLAVNDHGRASVDNAAAIHGKVAPLVGVLAFAAGVAGGVVMAGQRRAPQPEPALTQTSVNNVQTGEMMPT